MSDVTHETSRLTDAARDLVVAGLGGCAVFVLGALGEAAGVLDGRLAAVGLPAALLLGAGGALGATDARSRWWLWRSVRGSMRPTAAWVVGTLVVWGAATVAYARVEPMKGRASVFVLAAVLLVVGVLARARPAMAGLDAKRVVSLALGLYVASYTWAGVEKVEAYPLAPFQMYSIPRLDPFEIAVPRLVVTGDDGVEVDVSSTIGGATLRAWLSDPATDRVSATVRDLIDDFEQANGRSVTEALVLSDIWTVEPYPAPAEAVLVRTEVVLRVEG